MDTQMEKMDRETHFSAENHCEPAELKQTLGFIKFIETKLCILALCRGMIWTQAGLELGLLRDVVFITFAMCCYKIVKQCLILADSVLSLTSKLITGFTRPNNQIQ